jgi:uracil-DNA glycosylase family 4
MLCSRRVLSDLNGNWSAQLLFVAEAPGRLGAEQTGIPLFGDRTGQRFDEVLHAMDFDRPHVFITNAVLCNPRDERGNNATPRTREVENCSTFLKATLDLVNPAVVVALGAIALRALNLISPHRLSVASNVGTLSDWYGRLLGILYHPGPRSAVHRRWAQQLIDAVEISVLIKQQLFERLREEKLQKAY